jgi:PAS domain S-box-containing protein
MDERTTQLLGWVEDLARVGAGEFDLRTGEIYWTPGLRAIYEVDEAEVITLEMIEAIYSPAFQAAQSEMLLRAGEGPDRHWEQRGEVLTRRGNRRWVHVRARVVCDERGPWKVVGATRDITDEVRLEAEAAARRLAHQREREAHAADLERRVQARTAELAAANAELEAFAHSVSHDLRAPLRSIEGFSAALAEDLGDDLPAHAREHIGRIRRATVRMGTLIDDLLRLSRVTRVSLSRERVDVTAMVGAVIDQLAAAEPLRRVEFATAAGLALWADRGLLRVAVENLLQNAWKFTAGRGDARVEVFGGARDGELVVRDNGAGFDARYADKLFGAFQRLHTEREFPGTGVGLATVMRVARRHGGTATAEGAVGRGATFTLFIPPERAGA